ncbi:hypothetical protein [Rhizobium azibense]|uniref:Uncharacterized protein n=1 Tax=Rhizobium azibense TaxID=1136135 RepID=A0A4R3S2J4_9HYPH|nr:hypothetical protein [Rhizobium azibense]TCU38466.1 hypothetical protein EV129_10469 [Rhizobium azibense]
MTLDYAVYLIDTFLVHHVIDLAVHGDKEADLSSCGTAIHL